MGRFILAGVLILLIAHGTAQQAANHGANGRAFGSTPVLVMADHRPSQSASTAPVAARARYDYWAPHNQSHQPSKPAQEHHRDFVFHFFINLKI